MTALTFTTVRELRAHLNRQRAQGRTVSAVPTMGALHEGHLSLIREAASRAEEVVVTIFVNPTQFGPGEDFESYPRTLEADSKLAEAAGATIIFAPPVSEMYPEGERTRVRVSGLTEGLCGAQRSGHFEGVTTIVTKLFHVVGEAVYCFGRKDYQQLRVIERMAKDLLFPIEIVGCEIVREVDGLAMSSRNAYLSEVERKSAVAIVQALQGALEAYRLGSPPAGELERQVQEQLSRAGLEPEYAEVRDALELERLDGSKPVVGEAVLAVAAKLGRTRLIDNVILASDTNDLLPVHQRQGEE